MSCLTVLVPELRTQSTVFMAIDATSGACWVLAYALIIRRSFRDKTFGMPMAAACANISWEFYFAFVHPHEPPQVYFNMFWFGLDVVIFGQVLTYWKKEFPNVSPRLFYPGAVLSLALSFMLVKLMLREFNACGAYSAFGDNLMMSILFIAMLIRRNSVRGQSLYIAVLKMAGTALASLAAFRFATISQESVLLPFLFLAIFVCDAIYVVLVFQKCRDQTAHPWGRL